MNGAGCLKLNKLSQRNIPPPPHKTTVGTDFIIGAWSMNNVRQVNYNKTFVRTWKLGKRTIIALHP